MTSARPTLVTAASHLVRGRKLPTRSTPPPSAGKTNACRLARGGSVQFLDQEARKGNVPPGCSGLGWAEVVVATRLGRGGDDMQAATPEVQGTDLEGGNLGPPKPGQAHRQDLTKLAPRAAAK